MSGVKLRCKNCGATDLWSRTVLKEKRKFGAFMPCGGCGKNMAEWGERVKRGRSDDQKRSKKQEERLSKKLGAKRQKASGALPGAKGDLRKTGSMRGECKLTRAKSFSLKLTDLTKIESEAELGENPAFFIEFQCQNPPKRYVVLPEWLYEHYAGLAGDI